MDVMLKKNDSMSDHTVLMYEFELEEIEKE